MSKKKDLDFTYIAEKLSEVMHVPVRVYEKDQLLASFMRLSIPVDPVQLYIDKMLKIKDQVSYFIAMRSQFYGIITKGDVHLIVGPTAEIPLSREQARELLFLLGIKNPDSRKFTDELSAIPPMPLYIFLHTLCMMNYSINETKSDVSDVVLYDDLDRMDRMERKMNVMNPYAKPTTPDADVEPGVAPNPYTNPGLVHDTMYYENEMLDKIQNGDVEGLQNMFMHASAGQPGKIANSYIRQLKNIFITTVTLCSRAAIKGGMATEDALSLSDRFILACEKYDSPEQINNLTMHMVQDYAKQVADLHGGSAYSQPIQKAISYISTHIQDKITIEDLCEVSHLSRSQLTLRFKKETGLSPVDMIQNLKIKKAQKYLTETDKTVLEISTYLGFSSQSYFQKVFLKVTGMTPKKYREQ